MIAHICAVMLTIAIFATLPAKAAALDDSQIQQLLTDNTLTGRSIEGRFFSEFHKADGQVLGNNGFYTNTDACWIIKSSQVCYYYGEPAARTVHCFGVEKQGDAITLKLVPPNPKAGSIDAIARVETGNPRNHSDFGKPWVCDGLISRHRSGRTKFARFE